MSEPERPAGPARDGETKRYTLDDEFMASQRPGHDINRDAGIYPKKLVDRARAQAQQAAARDKIAAQPDQPAAHHADAQPARYTEDSPWRIEEEAHARRLNQNRADYLDNGPKILRPLRRLTLWTRNGVPPEKK